MESILEKSKDFEYLVSTFDPQYEHMVAATEIVKQFIINNKLVIYGGTAIDFALRLKGDKIYPDDMLKVPDLDFYSPTNVEHSYQLADILFMRGYRDVRAINAQHTETMRVDLGDNHWIADISYRPRDIFDKLPYLEYNGMRVIHPDFQRVDVHSSLSFPYDNAPREVIFERWNKDIKRFNKLVAHYPITAPTAMVPTRPTTTGLKGYVFTGFAAYAILHHEFSKLSTIGGYVGGHLSDSHIISGGLRVVDSGLEFDSLDHTTEIVHFDIQKSVVDIGGKHVKHYEPYINLLPERVEAAVGESKVVIYSSKHRLLSTNTVRIKDATVRITNIQFLLKYFLSMYFVSRPSPKLAGTYLSRYVSLLCMIAIAESKYTSMDDPVTTLFFPTVRTYGNENINLAREIALNRLYSDLDGIPPYKVPYNYYPARSKARGMGHPQFTPRDLEFFRVEGLEIMVRVPQSTNGELLTGAD